MAYKTFGQVNTSRLQNIERSIDALKRRWNGVARHYAERAEKDFLSVEDFYWVSADKVLSGNCLAQLYSAA